MLRAIRTAKRTITFAQYLYETGPIAEQLAEAFAERCRAGVEADILLDDHGTTFLTRRESPTEPPNYYIRTVDGKMTAMTRFPDPQPIFRQIKKQLVTYKRADGVDLTGDLYRL